MKILSPNIPMVNLKAYNLPKEWIEDSNEYADEDMQQDYLAFKLADGKLNGTLDEDLEALYLDLYGSVTGLKEKFEFLIKVTTSENQEEFDKLMDTPLMDNFYEFQAKKYNFDESIKEATKHSVIIIRYIHRFDEMSWSEKLKFHFLKRTNKEFREDYESTLKVEKMLARIKSEDTSTE